MKNFITLKQLQEAELQHVQGGQTLESPNITPYYGSGGGKWWKKKKWPKWPKPVEEPEIPKEPELPEEPEA